MEKARWELFGEENNDRETLMGRFESILLGKKKSEGKLKELRKTRVGDLNNVYPAWVRPSGGY